MKIHSLCKKIIIILLLNLSLSIQKQNLCLNKADGLHCIKKCSNLWYYCENEKDLGILSLSNTLCLDGKLTFLGDEMY